MQKVNLINLQSYFQHFSTSIKGIKLPAKFTFPFYYEPHELCKIAATEVQTYLKSQTDFTHNFGLDSRNDGLVIGKMFGVLVVENEQKDIGYITAVSGKLAETNTHKKFVPPVFDMLVKDSYFLKEEKILNNINQQIENLENNLDYIELSSTYKTERKKAAIDIKEKKLAYKNSKKERKLKREFAKQNLQENEYVLLEKELAQESLEAKYFLNNVTRYWEHTLKAIEEKLSKFQVQTLALKKQRKTKSAALQDYLFTQYKFVNAKKEIKNLLQIFSESSELNPPAGSGECAAPKLLQYAFLQNLKPIAMAEFWWGQSPNKEVRKHQQFYPACQGKCKPILTHMLKGIEMDINPMLQNPAIGKELEYLFEDEDMIVVNKPAEFLSVPGIHIQDSVYTRIKHKHPTISGPIIVHRLDMSTSGILVLAKNKAAHKELQRQFITKTVKKRYTAILEGSIKEKSGVIQLPLRVDLNDRPRQLVCFEHGKPAETNWEVIDIKNNQTKVHFYPITGRTHQLRVHASHQLGLNTAIVGDDLYGKKAERLYLHADSLTLIHPSSKKEMTFHKKAEF